MISHRLPGPAAAEPLVELKLHPTIAVRRSVFLLSLLSPVCKACARHSSSTLDFHKISSICCNCCARAFPCLNLFLSHRCLLSSDAPSCLVAISSPASRHLATRPPYRVTLMGTSFSLLGSCCQLQCGAPYPAVRGRLSGHRLHSTWCICCRIQRHER